MKRSFHLLSLIVIGSLFITCERDDMANMSRDKDLDSARSIHLPTVKVEVLSNNRSLLTQIVEKKRGLLPQLEINANFRSEDQFANPFGNVEGQNVYSIEDISGNTLHTIQLNSNNSIDGVFYNLIIWTDESDRIASSYIRKYTSLDGQRYNTNYNGVLEKFELNGIRFDEINITDGRVNNENCVSCTNPNDDVDGNDIEEEDDYIDPDSDVVVDDNTGGGGYSDGSDTGITNPGDGIGDGEVSSDGGPGISGDGDGTNNTSTDEDSPLGCQPWTQEKVTLETGEVVELTFDCEGRWVPASMRSTSLEDLQRCCDEDIIVVDNGIDEDTPCPGDPLSNIELAGQLGASGLQGGLFGNSSINGCRRFGRNDCSTPRNKAHNGLDLKSDFGEPIYAMYDGIASKHEFGDAGNIVYISSVIDGEAISIQYFHLQDDLRASGNVQAGDIIGYQGDSGNLKRAINSGSAVSHLHIKVKDSNNNTLDPTNFLFSVIDENGNVNINNCN